MRFLLSVIGLVALLWWSFVWRFDGKTPAQYAVMAWHSPTVQKRVKDLGNDIAWPAELPKVSADELPKFLQDALPKAWQLKERAKAVAKNLPEPYSDADRRELDAVIERAEKHPRKN